MTGSSLPIDPNRNRRHPLGLPAGSVRALLALMVFGLIWCLLLLPEKSGREIRIPLYLVYLMFLILGHYFAARGHGGGVAAGEKHPLYLPKGSLRFIMFAGFAGAMGWGFYHNPNFFDRLKPNLEEQPYLPILLLGAFFLGIIVARIGNALFTGPDGLAPWFQDILAWISLLAMVGLAVEIIVHLVINPTLAQPLQLPHWEGYIAALVGFYFGVKS
jgi:hypothetical protein